MIERTKTRREPSSVAPENRSARKRRTILDAGRTLFLQRGYLGTSIDQIAALAAVSKPTVYRFFADKEALLEAIVLGTLDQAGEPFRAGLPSLATSTDLAADLEGVARDYIAMVTQPSVLQLRRLVIGASHELPDLARTYYERAPERTLAALADVFQQLATQGRLQVDDPLLAASHFAFLVVGCVLDKSLFCGDRPFTRRELKAQVTGGVRAFLAAYGREARHATASETAH
jgi:TetR/AcrR family transcriptional regulator, mexJK operon transcriptional repressor